MKPIIIILTALLIITINLYSQTDLDGTWGGAIDIMGTELVIFINFTPDTEMLRATIDIPQQGATNLTLSNVRCENDSVYFELPAGPGTAVFNGVRDKEKISGTFAQAGIRGTFYLNRVMTEEETVEDETPLYREENVYIYNNDVKLGCTLTLPPIAIGGEDDGPHPAMVLITGSGAQDRDETIFGFKPFRLLADHLTSDGVAVLRCDDRGVGESTGGVSTSTSKDLAGDVIAKFQFLEERDDIDNERIGLCGHSEGGIIAAMVGAEVESIAFIISMAGSAAPGRDILIAQTELIFEKMEMDESITRKQVDLINRAYEAANTDEGWDEIEVLVRELVAAQLEQMTKEQRNAIDDTGQYLDQRVTSAMAGIQSEWYRFFIRHDPAEDWRRVNQPVLALFGELDLQVPPEMNARALKEALDAAGNTDYMINIIPQANHLFQKAGTGSPTEYAQLEKEFIDGLLDEITEWVKATVKH